MRIPLVGNVTNARAGVVRELAAKPGTLGRSAHASRDSPEHTIASNVSESNHQGPKKRFVSWPCVSVGHTPCETPLQLVRRKLRARKLEGDAGRYWNASECARQVWLATEGWNIYVLERCTSNERCGRRGSAKTRILNSRCGESVPRGSTRSQVRSSSVACRRNCHESSGGNHDAESSADRAVNVVEQEAVQLAVPACNTAATASLPSSAQTSSSTQMHGCTRSGADHLHVVSPAGRKGNIKQLAVRNVPSNAATPPHNTTICSCTGCLPRPQCYLRYVQAAVYNASNLWPRHSLCAVQCVRAWQLAAHCNCMLAFRTLSFSLLCAKFHVEVLRLDATRP